MVQAQQIAVSISIFFCQSLSIWPQNLWHGFMKSHIGRYLVIFQILPSGYD
jgi:hypothetical protein